MKNYCLSLLIVLTTCSSQAMIVRALNPLAKRLVSRVLKPKQAPHAPHTLQQSAARAVTAPAPKVARPLTQRIKLFKAQPKYKTYAKPTWLLPAALGANALSSSRAYAEPVEKKPWAELEEKYREEFKRIEKEGKEKLFSLLKITEQEWQTCLDKAEKEETTQDNEWYQLANHIPVSTKTRSIIERLLQQQGISPETIHIVGEKKPRRFWYHNNFMGVGTNYIAICEKHWINRQDKVIEATVFHEIQHLIHKDVVYLQTIKKLCLDKKIPTEQMHNIEKTTRLLFEKRADILGCLAASPEHAYAFSNFHYNHMEYETRLLEKQGVDHLEDSSYATHPLYRTRYAYLRKLYWEMLDCVNKQNKQS